MSVVADLELQRVAVVDPNAHVLGGAMLEAVRQSFLNDPERGELDGRRQRPQRALDLQRDVKTGRANTVDQPVELVEARLWLVFGGFLENPEHAAKVSECGARGGVDRTDRFPCARGIELERVVGRACLDDDHTERMGDDVVQLAGDPCLLFGGCAPRLAFSLSLEPVRLLFDLADVGTARADAVPEQRRCDQKDDASGTGAELDSTDGEDGDRNCKDRGDSDCALGTLLTKGRKRVEGDPEL